MNAERSAASRPRRAIAALLAIAAAMLLLDAGWIHAKAMLAQWLLQRAWAASAETDREQRPWPWADTHPVARLRMARLGVDQIVLAGDSGRSLAFGPGWAPASAAPGAAGTVVISAHRDTHFEWLRQVRVGDRIELDTHRGTRRYQVTEKLIADGSAQRLALDPRSDRLLLVTCWPFDAIAAGGTQRYVVLAD